MSLSQCNKLYVFIPQKLTSEDVVCRPQILTYKDGYRTERVKIFMIVVDPMHNIGIQMNRKEMTRTFMMISN